MKTQTRVLKTSDHKSYYYNTLKSIGDCKEPPKSSRGTIHGNKKQKSTPPPPKKKILTKKIRKIPSGGKKDQGGRGGEQKVKCGEPKDGTTSAERKSKRLKSHRRQNKKHQV